MSNDHQIEKNAAKAHDTKGPRRQLIIQLLTFPPAGSRDRTAGEESHIFDCAASKAAAKVCKLCQKTKSTCTQQ